MRTAATTISTLVLAATAALLVGACGSSAPEPPASAAATSTPLVRPTDPVQSNRPSPKPDPVSTERGPVRARPAQFGTDNDEGSVSAADPLDPCLLVTKAEARAVVGAISGRHLGRQGPTCLYSARRPARLVTVAVQTARLPAAAHRRGTIRLRLHRHRAYCVNDGGVAMLVPLGGGRLLRVGAPCPIAARFATAALPRLRG